MFEQILQAVKDHFASDPQLAASIPPEQAEAVHQEIAAHIHEQVQNQATANSESAGQPAAVAGQESSSLGSMAGGLLSNIEHSLASGGIGTSVVSGGLVGALSSKLGLPAAVSGAIAAAVPGLLQKFMQKSAPAAN